MATKIIHKKSSVAAKIPLATDLEVGEIAINLSDQKIFTKNTTGEVIELAPSAETSLLNLDYIDFDLTSTYEVSEGQLNWNLEDGTFNLGLLNGVTLQAGQEQVIYAKADTTIGNGSAVYASGAVGASGKITVNKFIANNTIDEIYFMGIATQDIATGNFGYITTFGAVRNLVTDGSLAGETWVDGTILYASPTTPGGLTSVKPEAPNLSIVTAIVVVAHATVGTIFVRPSTGYHLGELHDVHTVSPENNQFLKWSSAAGRWENKDFLDHAEVISTTGITSSVTETTIWSVPSSSLSGCKLIVTSTDNVTGHRTTSELLITHNDTIAVATEYGIVSTNSIIATYDVDISGNALRLLATASSTNETTYKVVILTTL